jgi:translation machinery-associated protein 16
MAKTLEKTRKQIAKKRNGKIEALHEHSRDTKRLHRAQVRDDRLEKMAEARRKRDQPLREWLYLSRPFLAHIRRT